MGLKRIALLTGWNEREKRGQLPAEAMSEMQRLLHATSFSFGVE